MTDKDYKDLIYSIIIPQELPQEEQNVRYQPLVDFCRQKPHHLCIAFGNAMRTVYLHLIKIKFGLHQDQR